MELTYDSVVKYMNRYFETFNAFGQNPETIIRNEIILVSPLWPELEQPGI